MKKVKKSGILEMWWYDLNLNRIVGTIYGDSKGRFKDGTRIHTSTLAPTSMPLDEGALVTTRNSTYLLGKRHTPIM